jgi:hypothetical protein
MYKINTHLLFKNKQRREPMKSHEIPDRSWQEVRIDLFELDDGENFMVIAAERASLKRASVAAV